MVHGSRRQFFLGHEPWALSNDIWGMSHEPWAMSRERLSINNRSLNGFPIPICFRLLHFEVSQIQSSKFQNFKVSDCKNLNFQSSTVPKLRFLFFFFFIDRVETSKKFDFVHVEISKNKTCWKWFHHVSCIFEILLHEIREPTRQLIRRKQCSLPRMSPKT